MSVPYFVVHLAARRQPSLWMETQPLGCVPVTGRAGVWESVLWIADLGKGEAVSQESLDFLQEICPPKQSCEKPSLRLSFHPWTLQNVTLLNVSHLVTAPHGESYLEMTVKTSLVGNQEW